VNDGKGRDLDIRIKGWRAYVLVLVVLSWFFTLGLMIGVTVG
jgi:hypothetical protein